MTERDPLANLLGELEAPVPPPDLRDRVLAEMLRAEPRKLKDDLWTRLWSSRAVRFAWAAAVVGLLVGHALLFLPSRSPATASSPAFVMAGALRDRDLAEIVDLQPIAVDLLPRLDSTTMGPHRDLEGRSENGI